MGSPPGEMGVVNADGDIRLENIVLSVIFFVCCGCCYFLCCFYLFVFDASCYYCCFQIDATSLFLLMLAQMTASGLEVHMWVWHGPVCVA